MRKKRINRAGEATWIHAQHRKKRKKEKVQTKKLTPKWYSQDCTGTLLLALTRTIYCLESTLPGPSRTVGKGQVGFNKRFRVVYDFIDPFDLQTSTIQSCFWLPVSLEPPACEISDLTLVPPFRYALVYFDMTSGTLTLASSKASRFSHSQGISMPTSVPDHLNFRRRLMGARLLDTLTPHLEQVSIPGER